MTISVRQQSAKAKTPSPIAASPGAVRSVTGHPLASGAAHVASGAAGAQS